ncbi:hypothetical protein V496_08557 [Pseudogymnoascus sp. VKM F-4515 (FW-2607)]|nr:hypothetical protein V496_08557 [Pseudogymnoascus sp. VKM F-4515 (FW-2607)]KFY95077.1 hypothetical protein V498_03549 [Pseudogymnoascus sp. VKM F-4517 (FW-2822)]
MGSTSLLVFSTVQYLQRVGFAGLLWAIADLHLSQGDLNGDGTLETLTGEVPQHIPSVTTALQHYRVHDSTVWDCRIHARRLCYSIMTRTLSTIPMDNATVRALIEWTMPQLRHDRWLCWANVPIYHPSLIHGIHLSKEKRAQDGTALLQGAISRVSHRNGEKSVPDIIYFFASGIAHQPLAADTAIATPPAVLAVNAAANDACAEEENPGKHPPKRTARPGTPVANTRHQQESNVCPAKVTIPTSRPASAMELPPRNYGTQRLGDPGDQHATSSVTQFTLGCTGNISHVEPHLASRTGNRHTDHVWEMSPRRTTTRSRDPDPSRTADAVPGNPINSLGQTSQLRPHSTIPALPPLPHSPRCRSSSVAEPLRQPSIHHAHLPDSPVAGCGKTPSDDDLREISFSLFDGIFGFLLLVVDDVHCHVHVNYIVITVRDGINNH